MFVSLTSRRKKSSRHGSFPAVLVVCRIRQTVVGREGGHEGWTERYLYAPNERGRDKGVEDEKTMKGLGSL